MHVAFICSANRARSPFAAALLRRHLDLLPVTVESYGTLEQRGAPALSQAIDVARSFGIDLTHHRARTLAPGQLAESDLVVGFEPFHVASAVSTGGVPRSRAFLLRELARVLGDTALRDGPPDRFRLAAWIEQADELRSSGQWSAPSIADPVGASDRRFLEIYRVIDHGVATIAERLFSVNRASPS